MLAVAVLGITATAFLLVSYYIFVTKCFCLMATSRPVGDSPSDVPINEDPLTSYSPSWQSRGLNELLIREIPTFQYIKPEREFGSFSKCVVCLNEFQDQEMLRVLPKCNHAFHLDCIDIWLQSNCNCPLCRSTISGRNRLSRDCDKREERDERDGSRRFLVQSRSHSSRKFEPKIGKYKPRKFRRVSIMGDEGINVREKDEQFCVQPIRRSFSMDSAVDRDVYVSVQEIIRQNRELSEVRGNEESSSRSRRSIFSFGHGRGSRNAVLPIE
ncbi:hypothetical protein DH2020_024631 [Rehmannia glutinosa]|uniref:RING-type E3 ubiquitin transferase n=1 Tax=Rehmannia glutinosa TaxID=99300 RepID=A0ABR0W1W9_REHGL